MQTRHDETQEEKAERRRRWLAGEDGVRLTFADLEMAEDHAPPQASGNVVGPLSERTYTLSEARSSGLMPDGAEVFDFETNRWVPEDEMEARTASDGS